MQRLQAVQQGGPMQLASVPIPEPEATEVCIKLHAIGLNPLDYKQLYNGELVRGWPASFGIDGAGVVTAVGGEVTQFKVGDRVMSLFGHGDRAAAFQEVAVVPEWHVAKLPQALSFEEGASLPICYLTALAAIYAGLRIVPPFIPEAAVEGATSTPPSNVLILGGSSSVGCSAIQLLRLCHPSLQILTTSSSEHHEHLHALGADLCFERKSQTLVKDIQSAITSNKGVDVILDAVGAMSTCPELFDTLKSANDNGRRAYSQVFTGAKVTVPDDVRGTIVFGRMVFQMPGGKEAMHSLSKLNDQEIYKLPNPVRSVGTGLAVIERGLEALRGGVSGVKLVVTVE